MQLEKQTTSFQLEDAGAGCFSQLPMMCSEPTVKTFMFQEVFQTDLCSGVIIFTFSPFSPANPSTPGSP